MLSKASRVSNLQPSGLMKPRAAINEAPCKNTNLLKAI